MITTRVHAEHQQKVFTDLERALFARTTARALNRTVEEVQTRLQQEIHAKLSVRSARTGTFLERMVKIKSEDRARDDRLVARIRVEGPEGDPTKAELLTRHIEGETSTKPGTALNAFFIPAEATRPSRMTAVPRAMYPRNLRLMDRMSPDGMLYARRTVTRNNKVQLKGKHRTFVLTERTGHAASMGSARAYGIYQRDSAGEISLLWLYSPRVRIPARWDFYGIAERTFATRFPINWEGMWAALERDVR